MRDPNLELWLERHGELSRAARKERCPGERSGRFVQKEIKVRWGLPEDEPEIGELLERKGMLRPLAFEERFIVAEEEGKVLAAVRYRTERKRLLLGLLVTDPWAGERRLAVALYDGAGELAREIGVKEVFSRSLRHGAFPYEAGYRRVTGGWRLDATRAPYRCRGLPAGGWRKKVALLGILAIPFFDLKTNETEIAHRLDTAFGESA